MKTAWGKEKEKDDLFSFAMREILDTHTQPGISDDCDHGRELFEFFFSQFVVKREASHDFKYFLPSPPFFPGKRNGMRGVFTD